MPRTSLSLPVEGSVGCTPDGPLLVLTERLGGHDTFLSGRLDLDGTNIPVRIMTLDDVTVLHPTNPGTVPALRARWSGTLHLPHGLRPQTAPGDLESAAEAEGRILGALDDAELRYALTFLSEATTREIRTARIAAIVSALPPARSAA